VPSSVHFLLVSEQPAPNLFPAVVPPGHAEDFPPGAVVLVVSRQMKAQADRIEPLFRSRGIEVRRLEVDDPFDADALTSAFEEKVVETIDILGGKSILLNATGGTKLMALAAVTVFQDMALPIYYVGHADGRVIWLMPRDRAGFSAQFRIRLPEFLAAHGYDAEALHRDEVPTHFRELTAALIDEVGAFGSALSTLNWVAARAKGSLSVELEPRMMQDEAFGRLVRLFSDAGLIEKERWRLRFADEKVRRFVNGLWLEQHVFGVARSLFKDIASLQDVATGLEVAGPTGVKNEIDVALLAGNRLFLIECKTRRFDSEDEQNGAASGALYKLKTLRDLGGLKTRAMLVSYQSLPDYEKDRAAAMDISVVEGRQLTGLRERILRWVLE
jgi:hypothetical protein